MPQNHKKSKREFKYVPIRLCVPSQSPCIFLQIQGIKSSTVENRAIIQKWVVVLFLYAMNKSMFGFGF